MDKKIDKKIIKIINKDGKTSLNEIAKQCKISIGTARNRLTKLYNDHIIVGLTARVRFSKIGMQEAIVGFDVLPEGYMNVLEKLKDNEYITEIYRTSGDHSIIAMIVGEEEDIDKIMQSMLKIKGVKNVYPAFIQEIVK
jgi:DNA-binding Lrp family transcriptional regulator